MNVKPDRRIGAALERALPDGAAGPGAKARIRAAIHTRTEENRLFRRTRGYFAAAAVAALVVTTMVYVQRSTAPPVPTRSSSAFSTAGTASMLVLSAGAKVLVQPGSDVVVERDDDRETSIRLENGRLFASVRKRNGKPFVIRSHDVRVDVVGTSFAVDTRGPTQTAVAVVTGKVRVTKANVVSSVAAGESWPEAAPRLAITKEELAWATAEDATSEPTTRALELPAPSREAPSDMAPPSAALPPGTPPVASRMPALLPSPADRRGGQARGSTDAASANPRAASTSNEPPRATDSPFSDAKEREAKGDWKGALAVYEAVAESASRDAEDALFAVARLRTKLGDAPGALLAFHAYRERYGEGAYARIVDLHVLDLVSKHGDDRAVLAEANAFLGAHPDDPSAWRFRIARAAMAIKRGDCSAALRDLAFVPDDQAMGLRARCPVAGPAGAVK